MFEVIEPLNAIEGIADIDFVGLAFLEDRERRTNVRYKLDRGKRGLVCCKVASSPNASDVPSGMRSPQP
jgi:hypothetical protein